MLTATASLSATWVYVGNADSQDLTLFELRGDGRLEPRGTVVVQTPAEPGRSMLLATSPDHRFLYAGYLHGARSAVMTYALDPRSGQLRPIGAPVDLADIMSYLATDRAGRFLLAASYGGNRVTVNPLSPEGSVGDTQQIIDTAAKAHCIIADPGNRYVLHTALGGDVIHQEKFDPTSGRLTQNTPWTRALPAGSGPRFLIFSSDGRFVYVIDELDAAIRVHPFAADGTLQPEIQHASALPPGFTGQAWGADIHLTPDGTWLYASERTSSTLAVFRVDRQRGTLTAAGHFPTVRQPRAFNIDASGRYLLSSGQLSNSLQSYAIDAKTGALTALAEYPVGKNPTWVEIVAIP